jgi:hypothetical protein
MAGPVPVHPRLSEASRVMSGKLGISTWVAGASPAMTVVG